MSYSLRSSLCVWQTAHTALVEAGRLALIFVYYHGDLKYILLGKATTISKLCLITGLRILSSFF